MNDSLMYLREYLLGNKNPRKKEEERCIDVIFGKDETYHMKIDLMDKSQLHEDLDKEVFTMDGDFKLTVTRKPANAKQHLGLPCDVTFYYATFYINWETRRYSKKKKKCR